MVLLGSVPDWCRRISGDVLVLPGDYLAGFGEKLVITIVLRKSITPYSYLVVPKYVGVDTCGGRALWCFSGVELTRVLPGYSPRSVSEALRVGVFLAKTVRLPVYGAPVSFYTGAPGSVYHCSGLDAALLHLRNCSYGLCSVVELLGVERLRVTGSLLLGSLHSGSDFDLVIGGYREAVDYLSSMEDESRSASRILARESCREEYNSYLASLTGRGLSPRLARTVADYTRLCALGRPVSVSLVSDELRLRVEKRVFITGERVVERVLRFEGFEESTLDYPLTSWSIDGVLFVSFDTVVAPLILGGGCFRVRGVEGELCYSPDDCVEAVFFGVRETSTSLDAC